jgi:phage terminase large subunit
MPNTIRLDLPRWTAPFFQPFRYKVAYGGRGAARSWSVARILLTIGAQKRLRILCTRELQSSIAESVHKLLVDQIELLQLPGYIVEKAQIRHVVTGTVFFFEGLRYNLTKIKSIEGIDICWVEEAERISQDSWSVLIPTIRKSGSEIWITFNPDLEEDPTYQRFVVNVPPRTWKIKVGWQDNPWFPAELREEMEYAYRVDPEAADWVWGGNCRKAAAAAVLRNKWKIDTFTPNPRDKKWLGPYHGLDFGFGEDPTAATRTWIWERRLFIEYECWKRKLELDHTKKQLQLDIPDIQRYLIRADNARPESISFLKRHGLSRIVAVSKWPGSVEDGVTYLRSFEEIIIHPRCKHTHEEARLYSHKVDKMSGDILRDIVDKHNHTWDSIRYGLANLIRAAKTPASGYSGISYPNKN